MRLPGGKVGQRFLELRDSTDEFTPDQFVKPPTPIPWKSIGLSIVLFVLGSLSIIMGVLLTLGIVNPENTGGNVFPFLLIGALLFIPGAYHVRIAYYSYKGYEGYDFDQIPDY